MWNLDNKQDRSRLMELKNWWMSEWKSVGEV